MYSSSEISVGLLEDAKVSSKEQSFGVWYQTLEQALETSHACDAHLLSYAVRQPDQSVRFHRVKKNDHASDNVVVQFIGVDLDLEPHDRWASQDYAEQALVDVLNTTTGLIGPPTAIYTTRAGLRLIYGLTEPVSGRMAERVGRGVRAALMPIELLTMPQGTLRVDDSCGDWTRLFRLPRVLRDGEMLESLLIQNSGAAIDPAVFDTGGSDPVGHQAPFVRLEAPEGAPDEDEAYVLAWSAVGTPSPQLHDLRVHCSNALYDPVFNHELKLPEGSRNASLTRIIGGLCGVAKRVTNISPELIYGACLPMIGQLEPDADTPDWREVLWSLVSRFYEGTLIVTEDDHDRFLSAIRKNFPNLSDVSAEELEAWLCNHVVVVRGSAAYFLQSNGCYCYSPVDWATAVHRIVQNPITSRYSRFLYCETEKGKRILKSKASTFKDEWPCRAVSVIATSQAMPIDIMAGEDQTLPLLVHQVDPWLSPKRDSLVDNWLKSLVAEDDYDHFERYLAAVPFTDLPLLALWLVGRKNVGKTLLGACLGRLFGSGVPNTKLMNGNHDGHLVSNPIVFFDETIQVDRGYGTTISEMIRATVGHLTRNLNMKFVSNFEANIRLRMLFASNGTRNILGIIQKEGTNAEDRRAIADRFATFKVQEGASYHCAELVTACRTQKVDVRKVVAEHVLYLSTLRERELRQAPHRLTVEKSELSRQLFEDQARANGTMISLLQAISTLLLETKSNMVEMHQRNGSFSPSNPGVVSAGFFAIDNARLDMAVRQVSTGGYPNRETKFAWFKSVEADFLVGTQRIRVQNDRVRVQVIDLFKFCIDLATYTAQPPPPEEILASMAIADPAQYQGLEDRWPDMFKL